MKHHIHSDGNMIVHWSNGTIGIRLRGAHSTLNTYLLLSGAVWCESLSSLLSEKSISHAHTHTEIGMYISNRVPYKVNVMCKRCNVMRERERKTRYTQSRYSPFFTHLCFVPRLLFIRTLFNFFLSLTK